MIINKISKRTIKAGIVLLVTITTIFICLIVFRDVYTTTYFSGDGLSGEKLRVYFGLLYSYDLDSDIGKIHEQFGYITKSGDKYIFQVFSFDYDSKKRFPRSYYQIFWSGREYLIEDDAISSFCSSFNSGYMKENFNESMSQSYLVNKFTEKIIPYGKPIVPQKFKKQIFNAPIEAKVLEKSQSNYSLLINKGLRDNLFIGCTFYDTSGNGFPVDVINLYDSTALLQNELILRFIMEGNKSINISRGFDAYKLGTTVSTLNYKNK
jgi:hypothetical protein